MNTPQYLVNLSIKRAYYNVGKVLKEAGLGKNIYQHNSVKIDTNSFIIIPIAMDRFGSRIENDVAYMQELSRHR